MKLSYIKNEVSICLVGGINFSVSFGSYTDMVVFVESLKKAENVKCFHVFNALNYIKECEENE